MLVSRVKQVMEARGFTIKQLVEASGLAEETIMRARRGGGTGQLGSCTLQTLEIMANALGVKVKDLFEEV
ncbi:MAG: helix-turn-helix transcriptional regulator [Syntrophobacteraceae bacterium]|jgi:transcriptional regulator with XRE-family HTH domain